MGSIACGLCQEILRLQILPLLPISLADFAPVPSYSLQQQLLIWRLRRIVLFSADRPYSSRGSDDVGTTDLDAVQFRPLPLCRQHRWIRQPLCGMLLPVSDRSASPTAVYPGIRNHERSHIQVPLVGLSGITLSKLFYQTRLF